MTKIGIALALALALPLAACGGGKDPAALCKKMENLATKEGGEALETFKSHLGDDCKKELEEAKKKLGDDKFNQAADCIMKADSFAAASACGK